MISLPLSVHTSEHQGDFHLMHAEEVGVSSPATLMLGNSNSSILLSLLCALPALLFQPVCLPSSVVLSFHSPLFITI